MTPTTEYVLTKYGRGRHRRPAGSRRTYCGKRVDRVAPQQAGAWAAGGDWALCRRCLAWAEP